MFQSLCLFVLLLCFCALCSCDSLLLFDSFVFYGTDMCLFWPFGWFLWFPLLSGCCLVTSAAVAERDAVREEYVRNRHHVYAVRDTKDPRLVTIIHRCEDPTHHSIVKESKIIDWWKFKNLGSIHITSHNSYKHKHAMSPYTFDSHSRSPPQGALPLLLLIVLHFIFSLQTRKKKI